MLWFQLISQDAEKEKQKKLKRPAAAMTEGSDKLKMDRKNIHCRAYNASLKKYTAKGWSVDKAKKQAAKEAQDVLKEHGFKPGQPHRK